MASRDANSSTCTEWSITSSTGISGLIAPGSPPWSRIASRIAARSTTHGTPVKSCSSTRAGAKEISRDGSASATQRGDRFGAFLGALPEDVLEQDPERVREPGGSVVELVEPVALVTDP